MSPREGRTIRKQIVNEAADGYLTIDEFATMMRVHPKSVRRLVRKRKLPGAFRVGGHWRIDLARATAAKQP
jgi:excisionase family DNA binding protein